VRTLLALVLISLGALATGPAKDPVAARDGRWWLSVSGYEQAGFLNGYFDCYAYELRGPDRYTSLAVMYQSAITEFYRRSPSPELDVVVPDLLHRLRDPAPPFPFEPFGGRNAESHGRNDGLYWREISSHGGPELEQLGFVEGYLACHAGPNHGKGGSFSKPASEYVASITRWYRFEAATGEFDSRREPAAIAEVLFRFRD
jgi:hypothetical protein